MVVIVSNIPSPYREPVFQYVFKNLKDEFVVVYCQNREADREWNFKEEGYPRRFLRERVFSYNNLFKRFVHVNVDVWWHLNSLNPEIVITNGYNPTHLIAFLWVRLHKKKHIAMTDGWLRSESSLTFIHRIMRRIVLKRTDAFIGASNKSLELFQYYRAPIEKCFLSYLCANNQAFKASKIFDDRKFDVLFSGRFIESKMPGFFCEVILKLKQIKDDISVMLMGDGELRQEVCDFLKKHEVSHHYAGFVAQDKLHEYYENCKVLLFPTQTECWGVVVNEACAAGMSIITCDNTAAAGELVVDGDNGYVLQLNADLWAHNAIELIENTELFSKFSRSSIERVKTYTYENAGQGIVDAINFVKYKSKSS